MKADKVAMVIGQTIHLHKTSKEEFLNNKKWLRHEVAHVYQWLQHGKLRFLVSYLFESFNKGYENNRFEIEARNKENDVNLLNEVIIL